MFYFSRNDRRINSLILKKSCSFINLSPYLLRKPEKIILKNLFYFLFTRRLNLHVEKMYLSQILYHQRLIFKSTIVEQERVAQW